MKRIALAEDVPFQVELLKAGLSRPDDRTLDFYSDGLELYRAMISNPPDLAVFDIIMPRLSGLAATRLLKFHRKTRHIKIIIVSSITDSDIEEMAHACGGDAFMAKPLDFNKLDRLIEDLLRGDELHADKENEK